MNVDGRNLKKVKSKEIDKEGKMMRFQFPEFQHHQIAQFPYIFSMFSISFT